MGGAYQLESHPMLEVLKIIGLSWLALVIFGSTVLAGLICVGFIARKIRHARAEAWLTKAWKSE